MYYAINIYANGRLIETAALLDSHAKANRIADQLRAKLLPGQEPRVERCRVVKRW